MSLRNVQSLLVVKPSSLGDIVHTIPAVVALHRAAPEAEVRWLVNAEWSPLLEGLPFLRETVAFPRREFRGPLGGLRARQWAQSALVPLQPDLAVDFQGLFRSAWLARASGAERVAGFQQAREGAALLYGERVDVRDLRSTHAVDRYLQLARACGADGDAEVEFLLPPGRAVDDGLLPEEEGWILLHPFSRGTGKSLSPAEVAEFCGIVAPRPVVLVGSEPFPGACGVTLPGNARDLGGKTDLLQLIHLIRRASWTISVDSGPMHLAAALTDRVVSLHSWTDPRVVGPWPEKAWAWREGTLLRVGDIEEGRFPERRSRRKRFEAAPQLLQRGDWEKIAALVCS